MSARFRVLIKGRNLRLASNMGTRIVGFVTTRYVDATSTHEAREKALTRVRDEPEIANRLNQGGDDMHLEAVEIEQVSWFRGRFVRQGGFTFVAVSDKGRRH